MIRLGDWKLLLQVVVCLYCSVSGCYICFHTSYVPEEHILLKIYSSLVLPFVFKWQLDWSALKESRLDQVLLNSGCDIRDTCQDLEYLYVFRVFMAPRFGYIEAVMSWAMTRSSILVLGSIWLAMAQVSA